MSSGRGRLHIASTNGLDEEEYRICNGRVEVADLGQDRTTRAARVWRRLTPAQLSLHVERNTLVAQWLERRLGWRRLLRACLGLEAPLSPEIFGEDFGSREFQAL